MRFHVLSVNKPFRQNCNMCSYLLTWPGDVIMWNKCLRRSLMATPLLYISWCDVMWFCWGPASALVSIKVFCRKCSGLGDSRSTTDTKCKKVKVNNGSSFLLLFSQKCLYAIQIPVVLLSPATSTGRSAPISCCTRSGCIHWIKIKCTQLWNRTCINISDSEYMKFTYS